MGKRLVTNTPLQALVTLNDPVYLDAAKALSQKVWEDSGKKPEMAIQKIYEKLMLLPISESKKASMLQLFRTAKSEFDRDPKSLSEFYPGADAELAALAVATNAIMNLDEFLTKP